MKKILSYLKSRTVLLVIATFVINGLVAVKPLVSPEALIFVDAILGILTIYFRVKPKQKFE